MNTYKDFKEFIRQSNNPKLSKTERWGLLEEILIEKLNEAIEEGLSKRDFLKNFQIYGPVLRNHIMRFELGREWNKLQDARTENFSHIKNYKWHKRRKMAIELREKGWSFQRIGDTFGVTRQRIQQMLKGYKERRNYGVHDESTLKARLK